MGKRGTIRGISFLFTMIVLMIFIGAMNRVLTLVAIATTIVCAFMIAVKNRERPDSAICKWILSLLILQNLCIGMGAHFAHNTDSSLQYLTQIPFISTAIIWFISCVLTKKRVSPKPVRRWFLVLLFCLGLSIIIGLGNIKSAVVSFRNYTVFYMAFCIGKKNTKRNEEVDTLVSFLMHTGVVLTFVGIIIWLGGYDYYKAIGIHEVYIAKAAPFTEGGLDGRFYTSLFSGKSFIRMGSLYYEPVSLGYYLSACFVCGLYSKKWAKRGERLICTAITCIGLILTVGKGGYLITAAVIVCMTVEKIIIGSNNNARTKRLRKTLIGLTILTGAIFIIYYINHFGYAVLNHIKGIQGTWENVIKKPLGYGLGTGGNMAQVFSDNAGDWLSTGGETALMSLAYQTGIQGAIAMIGCFASMSSSQKASRTILSRVFIYIPYILLGVSLMQDNTFTPQCIIPFMLMQGAVSCVEHKDCYNTKSTISNWSRTRIEAI